MPDRALPAWRWMIAGELRAFPARFVIAGLAIAVGVALAFAVHVINRSAAEAFGEAVRSAAGEADLSVRAASGLGFDELLYPRLVAADGISDASPVVELRAELGDSRRPITLLGLDILRAASVSPSLAGRPRLAPADPAGVRSATVDALLDGDNLYLSPAALAGLDIGVPVAIRANGRTHRFRLAGDLPGVADQSVAVVDIAAAQWRFDRLGMLDRIDLKLAQGASPAAVRQAVAAMLPATARMADADDESRRGSALSRAYRVNLDMLALVALITGGFLVYSAQWLSVARRLRQFALLRTLGLERRSLRRQLIGEGLVLGVAGAAAGLALGYGLAGAVMRLIGPDLGAGYFAGEQPVLRFAPAAALSFFLFGIAVAVIGSYGPARAAERIAPAEALKGAGEGSDARSIPSPWLAAVLLAAGAAAAALPPVGRLPLAGYVAVGLILAGGVAAMPWLARRLLQPLGRCALPAPLELALDRLLGAPRQAAIALGGIVASTGLMIAMAVMVTSFRGSVDEWLSGFLRADLYMAPAASEPLFDRAVQQRLEQAPGVRAISFSKAVPVTLDPALPPVQLIVRPVGGPGYALPLIARPAAPGEGVPLWVSEPAARLHGLDPGERLTIPLGREPVVGWVAGIWRDYARQQGAIMIDSGRYGSLTGDWSRSEAAVMLDAGASPATVQRELRRLLPDGIAERVQFADSAALRARAMALFDRSFAITHVLEAIAIMIGLAGVATTISAQTIARLREFGMLRHLGMERRQILAMLASEGALLGLIGVAAGVLLGLAVSQILIHVINPQSFNWTMSTRLPWRLMALVAAVLIVTSAATAAIAGRRAVSRQPVRAVSEDW